MKKVLRSVMAAFARSSLMAMSDRQLNDIGLDREEIRNMTTDEILGK